MRFYYKKQGGKCLISDFCACDISKCVANKVVCNIHAICNLENGKLVIVPKEAEVVKMIFSDYLSGMGKNAIVRKLSELKIDSKFKKSWHENVVDTILRNEKYVGDMIDIINLHP